MVPQLMSGARGLLLAGGVPLATVVNCNVNVNDSVRAPHTFGAYNARSVEPLSTNCSVQIGTVIPVSDPTGKATDQSAIALGIEPVITAMATAEDITIELQDKVTGATISNVKNCRFANRTMNLAAQSLGNSNWSLVGIYDAVSGNSPDQIGF